MFRFLVVFLFEAEIDKLVAEYNKQQADEVKLRDWCIDSLNTNERDTAAATDKQTNLQVCT